MQPAHAADLRRFAPIVALDGGDLGRALPFAMEVGAHPEAHVRLACAIGALISAQQERPDERPIAVMVALSLDELARVDVESLASALAPAHVEPDLLMVRVPQYTAGARTPILERVAATGVTIVVGSLFVRPGDVRLLAGAPVDLVELPPPLVDAVDHDREAAQRVDEWMALAHSIDWLVLARNVRRPTQAQTLERLGCDLAAGPLMGAPLEPSAFGRGGRRRLARGTRLAG